MWKRWFRLGVVVVAVALTWAGWRALDSLHIRGELLLARREMSEGRFNPARLRLAALTAGRPGALGGQVDYWLGVCESQMGQAEAALAAFGRVPSGYVFDVQAAYLEAQANLQRGRLRAAETRLEETLKRGGRGLNDLRRLLSRVYEIQLRVEDSLSLYRDSLPEADDPFPLLQRISSLEGGTLPLESLQATLEEASQLAPDDDRVWLGQARLAIRKGDWHRAWEELHRCRDRLADAP